MIDWTPWVRRRLDLDELSSARANAVVDEIAQLLDEHYRDLRARGVADADAAEATRNHIDDWQALRDSVVSSSAPYRKSAPQRWTDRIERRAAGRHGRWNMLSDLWKDTYSALRGLRTSPGSSIVVVLTLALGIGASTAIFSVLEAVVLQPLPYPDADRLGLVTIDGQGVTGFVGITPSNVLDFREQSSTLAEITLYGTFASTLQLDDGGVQDVAVASVTPGLTRLLGIVPLHGRHLDPAALEDDGVDEVLVAEELWEREFGGDPDIVGREIRVNDDPKLVVGIVPRGTRLLVSPDGQREHLALWTARSPITQRGNVFGRRALVQLVPGVTFQEASVELNGIAERSRERDFQNQDGQATYRVVPLHDKLVSEVRPTLYVLFAAVGFVLLLACVNVANLLLVRGLRHRREWAVRAALGASRGRILRHGLIESLALALVGGTLGIGLAVWVIRLVPLLYPGSLPRGADIALNGPGLLFAALLSLSTSVLFGLAPAWMAARQDPQAALREGGRGNGQDGSRRVSRLLVAAQLGIALPLVVGAGLMLRTFVNLNQVDLGFRSDGVLTFAAPLAGEISGSPALRIEFSRRLVEELEALPGVVAASMTNIVPLSGRFNSASWAYDEASIERFGELSGLFRRVMPGYFAAMGMSILAGRDFNSDDVDNDRYVLIVSEAMAARAWPGDSPLGKRVTIDFQTPSGMTELRETEVVGLVPDIRERTLHGDEPPSAYLPLWSTRFAQNAVVRTTSGDPLALVPSARAIVERLGSGRPIRDIALLDDHVAAATQDTRFVLSLVGLFSSVAVLLASLGIYGVVAQVVGRRQHEIGVRMALGARRNAVLRMVLGQGLGVALAGLGIGVLVALLTTRLLESFLYGVAAWDLLTYAGVVALMLGAATAASLVPAAEASRVDPTEALRAE